MGVLPCERLGLLAILSDAEDEQVGDGLGACDPLVGAGGQADGT